MINQRLILILITMLVLSTCVNQTQKMEEQTMKTSKSVKAPKTDFVSDLLTKEQAIKIDSIFADYNNNTPGCAVGVIQNGQFVYKKSFGMANLDYDIPLTADSKFELASTSKQFTAACIVLLNLEDKLNLDDDVRKYINEVPDYGKTITIRHLLNHTSGIRDYLELMSFSDIQFNSFFTTKDGVRLVCKQKELDFLPGEKFSYSNSGYLLLAEIVERVSGITIKKYADGKIFKPLKMNDTFYNDDCTETMKDRVISYDVDKNGKFSGNFYNFTALGDGGVVSTVNDLLKWDGNFFNPQVGGQKMLDHLLTKGILNNGDTIPYALGLRHNSFKGLSNINHGGSFFGFRSQLIRFPEQKTSIIVLANRADADPDEYTQLIADILLKPEAVVSSDKKVETKTLDTISLKESELEKFCASYWCEEGKLDRKIYLKEGKLFYWRNENSESKLLPVSQNELIMVGTQSDVKLVLKNEQNSKIINFYQDGKITSVFKSYQSIDASPEYLAKYAGKYFCEELDMIYQLKIETDKLALFIKDKQISEVKASVPDVFEIKEWGCYISFLYNENKQIFGFKLDTDRAKNIKFIKL